MHLNDRRALRLDRLHQTVTHRPQILVDSVLELLGDIVCLASGTRVVLSHDSLKVRKFSDHARD